MTARPRTAERQQLAELHPTLEQRPAPLRHQVHCEQAVWLSVPQGAVVWEEQAPCQGFPLALDGEVLLTSHRALADELGTVREMVTRLLRRGAAGEPV